MCASARGGSIRTGRTPRTRARGGSALVLRRASRLFLGADALPTLMQHGELTNGDAAIKLASAFDGARASRTQHRE
eukprot:IDg17349t1